MKRLYLALTLLGASCGVVFLPGTALAVATTKVALTFNAWTDLGVGPLQLNSGGTQIYYSIADTTPPLPAVGFAVPTNTNQVVNTAAHVWAIAATPNAASVVVAPVAGTSGSGGTFTWPGSATLTSYGTAPTGTVPAVNTFCTNCSGGGGGGGAVTMVAGAVVGGAYLAGALADGASATMGLTTDATWSGSGAGTEIAVLKKIALAPGGGGGAVTQAAGSVAAGAYVAGSMLDGAMVSMGLTTDTVWSGSGNGTEIAILKKIAGNTATFNGAVTVAAGADISEGNITDTAWSGAGNATVIAALKKLGLGVTTTTAVNVTPTSCSLTISAANTAQNLPNLGTANIHGFHIVNKDAVTGAGEGIGINFIGAATLSNSDINTIMLPPPIDAKGTGQGSFTTSGGEGLNHAVSVISATANHVVFCMFW